MYMCNCDQITWFFFIFEFLFMIFFIHVHVPTNYNQANNPTEEQISFSVSFSTRQSAILLTSQQSLNALIQTLNSYNHHSYFLPFSNLIVCVYVHC